MSQHAGRSPGRDLEQHFLDICGFAPTPEQQEIFNFLSAGDFSLNPLLVRLPCGYGKTEAVIAPYLAQVLHNQWLLAPRLIYVLPTRALCNQIRDRIQSYANNIEQKFGKKIVVGIEHGVSSLDPLFFADICVTTFDQFLYGYARAKRVGRHFDLPAGSIANSIVVFDEAHLYSPYTHSLVRALLEILTISRIPTILMTATMPKSLEVGLLKNENIRDYERIEFRGKWPNHMGHRTVKWHQEEWGFLEEEKISSGLNKVLNDNQGKRILIVANRVDVAQRVVTALKDRRDLLTLIHSRFTVSDREKKEREVCRFFGKDKNEQKPGIIVSTQVCEVGLDISCDILITECAAADALVQRIGRVARWGGEGIVYIVKPLGREELIGEDWSIAYPYVDKNNEGESEFAGRKKGEFAGIAWEYLKKAPPDLFIDWGATAKLCNTMDYHTDDVEARNALGQLFEATLYADELAWNLSARGEMYCSLAVIEERELLQNAGTIDDAVDRKPQKGKKTKIEKQIDFEKLRGTLVNISYRYLAWIKPENLRKYDFTEGKIGEKLDKGRLQPFQTYIIDRNNYYDPNIGLRLVKKEEPDKSEEAASCLIF